jgi:hypothetical protein
VPVAGVAFARDEALALSSVRESSQPSWLVSSRVSTATRGSSWLETQSIRSERSRLGEAGRQQPARPPQFSYRMVTLRLRVLRTV